MALNLLLFCYLNWDLCYQKTVLVIKLKVVADGVSVAPVLEEKIIYLKSGAEIIHEKNIMLKSDIAFNEWKGA